ncbi:hypothetical protein [Candidatus Skiveiella danica]|uniref:hypothetical protein n=1 Tax=Candidatus Skiveiella danica TaxID=3386177 RepID=UPI0009CAFF72|nr:MAG: hypothetical protein BWX79_00007 [Alphaproteobacteria bacterium ADurb.Bin100]
MVINYPSNLWLSDVGGSIPSDAGQRRRISGGPLLDLKALQEIIASGQLSVDNIWPATRRCRNSLEDYRWSFDTVLEIFSCLLPEDYKNSEWCGVDGNRTVPCDVYRVCFDDVRRKRNPNACEVYLKFSIDDAGALTLVLVQSHFS